MRHNIDNIKQKPWIICFKAIWVKTRREHKPHFAYDTFVMDDESMTSKKVVVSKAFDQTEGIALSVCCRYRAWTTKCDDKRSYGNCAAKNM